MCTIATWTSSGSTLLSESAQPWAVGSDWEGWPTSSLPEGLIHPIPAGSAWSPPEPTLAQPRALAGASCHLRPGLRVRAVTPTPSEGLAWEKPNLSF